MKIVIVAQSYYPRPGGVTENVHHTARELDRSGHNVKIITSKFRRKTPAQKNIIRLGRNVLVPMNSAWVNMTAGVRLGEKIKNLLSDLQPDIIHLHCPLVPTIPILALRSAPLKAKVVGTFHAAAESNYAYRLLRKWLEKQASRMDARVAVSQAALNLARKYFPGNYSVISNGIDHNRFSPEREPMAELRNGYFNILFVGRLDRRKGLKYLFKAASRVASGTQQKIRLIIVGEKSMRRITLPRTGKHIEVVFTGVVSREDIPRYYATCDLFCSPAIGRESFGIVLLEAMASGVPVIGTGIPGYLTLLQDRSNALVVPPHDPVALGRGITEIMEDSRLRNRLIENGLQFVQDYSWGKIAGKLERLYFDILSDRVTPTKPVEREKKTAIWV